MKLHHIRDFVAIAQARSVRAAARNLGLAQPALTRSLKELELELGTPLVERHVRGVTLTPAGLAFMSRAQCAMEELRRGAEEVAQLRGNMTGTVAVGLSSAAWLAFMPQAYPAFRKAFPDIGLHLQEGLFPMLEPRLRNGSLDFIVGPRPFEPMGEGYRAELLLKNDLVVVGGRGHSHAHVDDLRQLVDAEWLLSGVRLKAETELQDLFDSHGLPLPRATTRVDSLIGLAVLLATTDAVALMPRQWLDTPSFTQNICRIPIPDKIAGPDIVQISRVGIPLTPAAEYFSTMLKRVAVQLSARNKRTDSR